MLLVAALALGGCGTKNLGSKLAPADPSASEALGEASTCSEPGAVADPFVVDLRGSERSHLEAAMSEGVAVVRYDCEGLRLVKGCHVRNTNATSYAYTGVSIKEDVVQIKNADELYANLPASAVTIAAELSSGVSLDIAMMMVGRRNTVLDVVGRDQLEGPGCEEATHFVRSAIVGAFAVEKGTVGRARAAAEVFGAGAGGKSEADRRVANRDGVPEECKSAMPGDAAPPSQCRAAITLELYPVVEEAPVVEVAEGGETGAAEPAPAAEASRCPPGLVRTGNMCSKPSATAAHACRFDDPKECQTMCDRGDAASCYTLGGMFEYGRAGMTKDVAAADQLYIRACEAPDGKDQGCIAAAAIATRAKQFERAQTLLKGSCDAGSASACLRMGNEMAMGTYGKRDGAAAQRSYERACSLGMGSACSNLATSYLKGRDGAKLDPARGIEMLDKSCLARRVMDCSMAASAYSMGNGVKKDVKKALAYEELACEAGSLHSCAKAGDQWLAGAPPLVSDPERARASFERGCPAPRPGKYVSVDRGACKALHDLYSAGRGVTADPVQAQAFLERGCASRSGCADAAAVYQTGSAAIPKDLAKAESLLQEGCPDKGFFDSEACLALGKMVAKKDKAKAKALYLDRCTAQPLMAKSLCKAYLALGGKKSALVDAKGTPISLDAKGPPPKKK